MSKSKKNQLRERDITKNPPEEFPDGPIGAPKQLKRTKENKK